jgi:hypothetical protein
MRMRRRERPGLAWVSVGTTVVFLVAVSVPAGMLAPQRVEAASPLNTKYFHPVATSPGRRLHALPRSRVGTFW